MDQVCVANHGTPPSSRSPVSYGEATIPSSIPPPTWNPFERATQTENIANAMATIPATVTAENTSASSVPPIVVRSPPLDQSKFSTDSFPT